MGKRNKDMQVGRRRPMIQLGGSSQKSTIGAVSRTALREEQAGKHRLMVQSVVHLSVCLSVSRTMWCYFIGKM